MEMQGLKSLEMQGAPPSCRCPAGCGQGLWTLHFPVQICFQSLGRTTNNGAVQQHAARGFSGASGSFPGQIWFQGLGLTTIMSLSSMSTASHSVSSHPRSFTQFRLNLQVSNQILTI